MQDFSLFLAVTGFVPEVVRITIRLHQCSPEWLRRVNLPEPDTCHESTIFLVVKGCKFKHGIRFKMVKIPEAERTTMNKGVSGEFLDGCVKLLAECFFCGFLFPRNAVGKQVLIQLCCKVVEPV